MRTMTTTAATALALPRTDVQRRRLLVAAALPSILLPGCASTVRVVVDPGRVFVLSERDPGPAPWVVVVDEREDRSPVRQSTPQRIVLGAADVRPSPAQALCAELMTAAEVSGRTDALQARLAGRPLRLVGFAVTMIATNLVSETNVYGLPHLVLGDAGLRAAMQATFGSAVVIVTFKVALDGVEYAGVGGGKFTSNPGETSTQRPFFLAAVSLLNRLVPPPGNRPATPFGL